MRLAFAAFLLLHGLAHLVGFLTPWGLTPQPAAGESAPQTNSLFGGRITLSDVVSRSVSFLWLAVAWAFVAVAYGVWRQSAWSLGTLLVVSALSLIITLVWWPTARVGSLIDGALIVGVLTVGFVQYRRDLADARSNSRLGSMMILTSAGPIEYATVGSGEPILVLHGTGGGWDQGVHASSEIARYGFRIVAPSRFGYLRTPLPAAATPAKEADVWVTLLDSLRIQRAAVMAFSAGATPALQLALRHPDRVSKLVLFVPAIGGIASNASGGPPSWVMNVALRSDLPMWVTRKLSPVTMWKLMAVPPPLVPTLQPRDRARLDDVIDEIFPVSTRRDGIAYDASNESGREGVYPLERIQAPTLLISTEDDLYHTLPNARQAAAVIPHATVVAYPTGGHLLLGQSATVWPRVAAFLKDSTG